MKLSVAWIFDHIVVDFHTINMADMIAQLNQKSTETDGFYKIALNRHDFACAQIIEISSDFVIIQIANETIQLPCKVGKKGSWHLVKKEKNTYRWAIASDFGSTKEHVLPPIFVDKNDPKAILDTIEWDDYIIEIDNKAITHRPDLWGHRGFAQEIATILDLPLRPLDDFLVNIPLEKSPDIKHEGFPFTLNVKTPKCTRIAACYLPTLPYAPSLPRILARLCRIDTRAIDAYVDATNYVMNDIGQPMHAFNGDMFNEGSLIVRQAKNDESLTLLDGQIIECTTNDIVIANDKKILSLAGIMGGKDAGISETVTSCLVESAHFDATTIRLSAQHHKKRTEASARFEKNPDENQNIIALRRFLKLLYNDDIIKNLPNIIVSFGAERQPMSITVQHKDIEQLLGIQLTNDFVISTLQKLGCAATVSHNEYVIVVPTWRSSKDITIKEDIIEEIGRLYGYQHIQSIPPRISSSVYNTQFERMKRALLEFCAFGLRMHEIKSYAFFDASFLEMLKWQPENTVTVQSAVSQNWSQLATTLLPHVLKAISDNQADHQMAAFFENGRTWTMSDQNSVQERQKIAFAWYGDAQDIDFYYGKQCVDQLGNMVGVSFEWQQVTDNIPIWFRPYQTAIIQVENIQVGAAGLISSVVAQRLGLPSKKNVFLAELDIELLLQIGARQLPQLSKLNKYPAVSRDFTIILQKQTVASMFVNAVRQSDSSIIDVSIIDFFEKNVESTTRNITIRVTLQSEHKTLEHHEIDAIVAHIETAIKQYGSIA